MAVFKFSNVSGFKNYQRYNDFLAGNPAVIQDAGAYFPLGEFTLASDQANIEFTNIPQTYTHLQLRMIMRISGSNDALGQGVIVQFNGDTTTAYANHFVYGNGTSAVSGSETTAANRVWRATTPTQSTGVFGAAVYDILDYTSTNKAKTLRGLAGFDNNGAGLVGLTSSLWNKSALAAITSIKLVPPSNFSTYTQVALYGVLA